MADKGTKKGGYVPQDKHLKPGETEGGGKKK